MFTLYFGSFYFIELELTYSGIFESDGFCCTTPFLRMPPMFYQPPLGFTMDEPGRNGV